MNRTETKTGRKCIEKRANKVGTVFALVSDDITFDVYKLAENYNGNCKGGISKSWRCVQKGLNEADAGSLFIRRVGGRQR